MGIERIEGEVNEGVIRNFYSAQAGPILTATFRELPLDVNLAQPS